MKVVPAKYGRVAVSPETHGPGKVVQGPRPQEGCPGKLSTGTTCRYISHPISFSCIHHTGEPYTDCIRR